MHPILVIEWANGDLTETEFTARTWKLALSNLFDPDISVIGIWRKYPAMNEG